MLNKRSAIIPHFTDTISRCKYPAGLYLVATPIGNLEDMTLRALYTLKNVDKILCEDTRVTKKLLQHYGITKELISFTDYSDQEKINWILNQLKAGAKFALVSDAGTPLIADPGFDLVRQCMQHRLYITIIPGPCALIAGLTLSTLPSQPFLFGGFLPSKSSGCKTVLETYLNFQVTLIFYESPNRLLKTLNTLNTIVPQAQIAVVREITKIYESVTLNTPSELINYYSSQSIKGEIVLIISAPPQPSNTDDIWQEALLETMKTNSLAYSVKMVCQIYRISKNKVYTYALDHQQI